VAPPIPTVAPDAELERAVSEYLAISRGARLYASTAVYELAESRAWLALMRAADGACDQDDLKPD